MTESVFDFIIPVQTFGAPNFFWLKHAKFGPILQLQSLTANSSKTDTDVQNR